MADTGNAFLSTLQELRGGEALADLSTAIKDLEWTGWIASFSERPVSG